MQLLNSLTLICLIPACFAQSLDDPTAYDELSSSLSKRANTKGWIGQYNTSDCSEFPVVNVKEFEAARCANADMDPKHYCIAAARPKLDDGECVPWYPVLTAKNGPSLGVTFGAGNAKLSEIRFYKSVGVTCHNGWTSDDPAYFGLPSCCNDTGGGLLGMMHEDGTSDFGASYNFGLKHGMCAKIGSQPDEHNQALWETRYVKGIIGSV